MNRFMTRHTDRNNIEKMLTGIAPMVVLFGLMSAHCASSVANRNQTTGSDGIPNSVFGGMDFKMLPSPTFCSIVPFLRLVVFGLLLFSYLFAMFTVGIGFQTDFSLRCSCIFAAAFSLTIFTFINVAVSICLGFVILVEWLDGLAGSASLGYDAFSHVRFSLNSERIWSGPIAVHAAIGSFYSTSLTRTVNAK